MLKIDEQTAQRLYQDASGDFKTMLENTFSKEVLLPPSIITRTPTVEAAMAIAGKTIAELTRPTDSPHETAVRIIETVIKVLWEGVEVDHSNAEQDKYEPRFYHKSGLGLSFNDFVSWVTGTYCGPRLCYPTYDIMMHGIKILQGHYHIYLNSKN